MHRKIIFKDITSSIYRAMLKPVYRFGIPNSDPRTLKNANLIHLKIDKSSLFVVTEPRERCFALFRMQNNQTFLVFHPWTPLGAPPPPPAPHTPQLHNSFSTRYAYWKSGSQQKLLDTALKTLSELVDKSDRIFKGLKTKGCIADKNLKVCYISVSESI